MIEIGLTVLSREKQHLIKGRSIGLITNQTGVDGELRSNVTLFAEFPNSHLAALFSPEHGIWGNHHDTLEIPSATDERRRIAIHSLYGKTRQPTQEMLNEVDTLVYDIQDVGARFYTFISTMLLAMEAAAEYDVAFIVLDRPNPIRGDCLEGNLLQSKSKSFVGSHPLPIRHGLTVGELALLFKTELHLDLRLEVVPMYGWVRSMWYNQTGLPWVPPSPNIPTVDTAMLYPGACLIEGTNLSEGRGTTKPFEWIGSPWIDADGWSETLNDLEMPGVRFRPVHFTPTCSKYADELCHGVSIHIVDREVAKPVEIALHLISTVLDDYSDYFKFRHTDGAYFFDLLAGTDYLRIALTDRQSPTEIVQGWQLDLDEFVHRRKPHLMYS